MPSTFDPKRLFVESLPVAGVLLFWNVLAAVVRFGAAALGLRLAGVVMALLYVAGRVEPLRDRLPTTRAPVTAEDHLRENGRVLLAAGAWFLLAAVFAAFGAGYGLLERLGSAVASSAAGAGVAVVLLYAVPTAIARFRGSDGDGTATGHAPTGDDRPAASD